MDRRECLYAALTLPRASAGAVSRVGYCDRRSPVTRLGTVPERLDRIVVATTRGYVEVPWTSRDALLDELRARRPQPSGVIAAFDALGASRPLDLKPIGEQAVVDAIDAWMQRVEAAGLPPGIWELRNALLDDIADRLGGPQPGFFTNT